MSTANAAGIMHFPENSLEKKVYSLIDKYQQYLPVDSDRYRFSLGLFNYLSEKGDRPEVLIKSSKVNLVGISEKNFIEIINKEIENIA